MRSWDLEAVIARCLEIQAIPAPTGAEEARAAYVASAFRALGLADVRCDDAPNAYARVPGASRGPGVLVSAHTDTVFPAETELRARREGERVHGPGIGDNSLGVAGLLVLAEALAAGPPPARDVHLVANAAEEGLGDLAGMRAALDALEPQVAACVVLEGASQGGWLITHRALGSRRYRVRARAPGGHSWGDFGAASAVHALVRLADEITRWEVPAAPRSTFNIGVIQGGASVNTIAERAELLLDLRSEDAGTLAELAKRAERLFAARDGRMGARISFRIVGDRPAGGIPEDHPMVKMARARLVRAGVPEDEVRLNLSSTDANVPLSRGIPALALYLTRGGDAHRLSEWISTERLPLGLTWAHDVTRWAASHAETLQQES